MEQLKNNISNIKCSFLFKIQAPYLKSNKLTITKFGTSYFIVRYKCLVFSVYYSGHVNVTGLKSISECKKAYHYLKTILVIQSLTHFQVDNITFTSSISVRIITRYSSFTNFLCALEKHEQVHSIQYSAQRFPGAFIKLKTPTRGTIILFASGKYNIVGCNDLLSLSTVNSIINRITLLNV